MKRISDAEDRIVGTAYGGGPLAIGLLFVAAGTAMTLGGLGRLPFEIEGNAPLGVLAAAGAAFALAGLTLAGLGARGLARRRRRAALERRYPGQPWRYDYPWRPEGIRDRPAARVLGSLPALLIMALILVPLNWWAFLSEAGPLAVRLGVGLFDLVLLLAVLTAGYRALQALKYGRHQLAFGRFPLRPGEHLEVRLSPNRGLDLVVTLRYVEERYEARGSGKHRHTSLCAYEIWSERRTLPAPHGAREVPITFELPDNPEWVTRLTANPAVRYWELLIEAETPGLDLRTSFPLPVYACSRSQVIRPRPLAPLRARGALPFELAAPAALALAAAVLWLVAPQRYREAGELLERTWQRIVVARALEPLPGASSEGLDLVAAPGGTLYALTKYAIVRAAGDSSEVIYDPQRVRADTGSFQGSLAALALAPDGTLWAGTWQGALLRYQGGRWQQALGAGRPIEGRIHALAPRPEGIYLAARGGLWRLAPGGEARPVDGPPRRTARALAEDHSGRLVAGVGHSLWRLEAGSWRRLGELPARINVILARPGGRLLVGTDDGLHALAADGTLGRPALGGEVVIALAEAGDGRIWAGTHDGLRVGVEGGRWRAADRASGLPGRYVSDLAFDPDGRLWLAFYGKGVFVVPPATVLAAMR